MAENEPGAITEDIVDGAPEGADAQEQQDASTTVDHHKQAVEGAIAQQLAENEKPAFKAAVKPLVDTIHDKAGREVGMETIFTKGTGAVAGVQEAAKAGVAGLAARADQDEMDFLASLPGVADAAQEIANEEAAEAAKFEAQAETEEGAEK